MKIVSLSSGAAPAFRPWVSSCARTLRASAADHFVKICHDELEALKEFEEGDLAELRKGVEELKEGRRLRGEGRGQERLGEEGARPKRMRFKPIH